MMKIALMQALASSSLHLLSTHLNHCLPVQHLKLKFSLSRRDLVLRLPLTSSLLVAGGNAGAEENTISPSDTGNAKAEEDIMLSDGEDQCRPESFVISKRAFFDISIDGAPAGRVVVGLYADKAPAAAGSFAKLVTGTAGVSYRRKEFVKIMPGYIQHAGVRSYGIDAELASRAGGKLAAASDLLDEWKASIETCPGTKNVAGAVGLVVRNPAKQPAKFKLVAKNGKLEVKEEEVEAEPNGSEFVIVTKDSPELDSSAVVIGKVVEGMDVVEKMSMVDTVKENTSSPYFRVAKLIGDKRAVVAERGFNRPYSKIIVTNCGLLD